MALYPSKWAQKNLKKLPDEVEKRILDALKRFRDENRGNVDTIEDDIIRLRVGNYRAFIGGDWVLKVQHRREGYTPELIDTLIKRLEKIERSPTE